MQKRLNASNIWVVVPVYNEAKYLARFVDKLLEFTPRIIVVNDGSTDRTQEILANKPPLKYLHHLSNLGKGAAVKTGCEYAFRRLHAQAVIVMDGDDQHSVSDLPAFIEALKKGASIIHGVRRLDDRMPKSRIFANRSMSLLIRLLFGRYIADIPSGFKAFTRSAYSAIRWQSSGYEVETEIAVRIAKSDLSYAEVPISTVYLDKQYGFNLLDAVQILIKLPYWLWR